MDLAGVVEHVGPGVTNFFLGDEVWATAGGVVWVQGSIAEFAAVDVRLLAKTPTNLSMRQAAALPLVVITAWEGLVNITNVGPDDKVLVIGGAGGLGHVALQIARAHGAEAFGVAGSDAAECLQSIGAIAIDRTTPVEVYVKDFMEGLGFDIVYDYVGALDVAFQAIRKFGKVTSALGWGPIRLLRCLFAQQAMQACSLSVRFSREGYVNTIQVWPYSDGALYQVYASLGRVTVVSLQPGEELVTVASGDTVRWIVGDISSGSGEALRVSVLVKPTRSGLKTNLVITTSCRTTAGTDLDRNDMDGLATKKKLLCLRTKRRMKSQLKSNSKSKRKRKSSSVLRYTGRLCFFNFKERIIGRYRSSFE